MRIKDPTRLVAAKLLICLHNLRRGQVGPHLHGIIVCVKTKSIPSLEMFYLSVAAKMWVRKD